MRIRDEYDVCVIGSGASGAVVADAMAARGASVLLLEEGPRLAKTERYRDHRASWESAFVQDASGKWTRTGNPYSVCALGGGTSFFAGIAFRYREVDFDARRHIQSDALDPIWPINYEHLRPYYDELEHRLGVARTASMDPLQPASGTPPLPPHAYSPRGELLAAAGLDLGLRPFPIPLAINSTPYNKQSACERQMSCTEQQCLSGAKADVVSRLIDPLVAADAVTVRTNAKALRLLQDRPDHVHAVEWIDVIGRQRLATSVRSVMVAANAIQSAALLLRSQTRWFPNGIGNNTNMLGRGLSFKVSGYVSGELEDRPGRADNAKRDHGMHSTVAFSDYYLDEECPTGLGGIMYEANSVTDTPAERSATLRMHFLAGDQPMASNRVTLAKERNQFGLQYLRLAYRTHPFDSQRLNYLSDRVSRVLRTAGAKTVQRQASPYETGGSHLHGTCRAGVDPKVSVVDPAGRVHGVDNVYVVDGGFMPFAGGVNPTLTIQANALRIARHVPWP